MIQIAPQTHLPLVVRIRARQMFSPKRPFEIWSITAAIFATTAGWNGQPRAFARHSNSVDAGTLVVPRRTNRVGMTRERAGASPVSKAALPAASASMS
jgi:hypothetical protein